MDILFAPIPNMSTAAILLSSCHGRLDVLLFGFDKLLMVVEGLQSASFVEQVWDFGVLDIPDLLCIC